MDNAKKSSAAQNRYIAEAVNNYTDQTHDDMLSGGLATKTTELSDIHEPSTDMKRDAFSFKEASEHVSDSHLM